MDIGFWSLRDHMENSGCDRTRGAAQQNSPWKLLGPYRLMSPGEAECKNPPKASKCNILLGLILGGMGAGAKHL